MGIPLRWSLWLTLLLCGPGWAADGRVEFLSHQLQAAPDQRTRALAAMMLGAAGDPRALEPLCKGLSDGSDIVRSAVARSLAKIHNPAADRCLHDHLADDDAQVRAAVRDGLTRIEADRARKPFLYIALRPKTQGTATPDLQQLTLDYTRLKLSLIGALLAPDEEEPAAAEKVERAKGLKGFAVTVQTDSLGDGAFRVTLTCARYPGGQVLGTESRQAGAADPEPLLRELAYRALNLAVDDFNWRP